MASTPPRIDSTELETAVRTIETIAEAVGLDATSASGVSRLLVHAVQHLSGLGRLEVVETRSSASHRMTVDQ